VTSIQRGCGSGYDARVLARRFFAELMKAIVHHKLKDMAAQMAFWSLLALFPFCIFLLTIVGYVPLAGIEDELLGLLHEVMPSEAWSLFDRTVHEILHRQHGVLLVVSLGAAMWSASSGMSSTMTALNRAWGVDETRPWWRIRLRSLTMIIAAAVLIIIALSAMLIGPNVLRTIYDWFDMGKFSVKVWAVARWPLIILAMLSMLGGLYHFLPNVKRPLRLFTPGSVAAFCVWLLASFLFRVYVSHFHAYARTYGTLGAAIILLMWLYISSATVILGCEINSALDRTLHKANSESAA
jgi:membrane protein